MIKHHTSCSADYPEKVEGEAAQATTAIDLGDGEQAITCNDCGAFEIQKSTPLPGVELQLELDYILTHDPLGILGDEGDRNG